MQQVPPPEYVQAAPEAVPPQPLEGGTDAAFVPGPGPAETVEQRAEPVQGSPAANPYSIPQPTPQLTLDGPIPTGPAQSPNDYRASLFEEGMPPIPPAPEPPLSTQGGAGRRNGPAPSGAAAFDDGMLDRVLKVIGLLGAVLFGWFTLCSLGICITDFVYGIAVYRRPSFFVDAFFALLTALAWIFAAFMFFLHSKPHSVREGASLFMGAAAGAGLGLLLTVLRSILHAIELVYSARPLSPTLVTAGGACVFGLGCLYGAMYILKAEPFKEVAPGDALRDMVQVIPAVMRGSAAGGPAPKRPRPKPQPQPQPQPQPAYTMPQSVPLAPQRQTASAGTRQAAYTGAAVPPVRPQQSTVTPPPAQPRQNTAVPPPVQTQNAGAYQQVTVLIPTVETDRNLFLYILLNIITCGIFSIFFYYKWIRDINTVCEGDGRNTPGIAQYILLSLLTCGIYSLIWHYGVANRLAENAPRYGLTFSENGTTYLMWFLIGILLCGIGPLVGMYFLFRNTNALCKAYCQRQNGVG